MFYTPHDEFHVPFYVLSFINSTCMCVQTLLPYRFLFIHNNGIVTYHSKIYFSPPTNVFIGIVFAVSNRFSKTMTHSPLLYCEKYYIYQFSDYFLDIFHWQTPFPVSFNHNESFFKGNTCHKIDRP